MQIDEGEIDDAVPALLNLTRSEMKGVTRIWKRHDRDALNRLYEKGLISNPRTKPRPSPAFPPPREPTAGWTTHCAV